jgi:hypothetical protein
MMQTKLEECRLILSNLLENTRTGTYGTLPVVEILDRDFLASSCDNIFQESDVLYSCATCFTRKQMNRLIDKFRQLVKIDAIILMVDKQIDCDDNEGENEKTENRTEKKTVEVEKKKEVGENEFLLIDSKECATTWGKAIIYIYKKIKLS